MDKDGSEARSAAQSGCFRGYNAGHEFHFLESLARRLGRAGCGHLAGLRDRERCGFVIVPGWRASGYERRDGFDSRAASRLSGS